MFKDFGVDLYLPRLKAQTRKRAYEIIAEELAGVYGLAPEIVESVMDRGLRDRPAIVDGGIEVFDIQSVKIAKSVILVATLEHPVDYKAADGVGVDIIAAVISPPRAKEPYHLQKLSWLSRVMKSHVLCEALRGAKNADEMRVLFMPTQDWIAAA